MPYDLIGNEHTRTLAMEVSRRIRRSPRQWKATAAWLKAVKAKSNKLGIVFVRLNTAWKLATDRFARRSGADRYHDLSLEDAVKATLLGALTFDRSFDGSAVSLAPMVWEGKNEGRVLVWAAYSRADPEEPHILPASIMVELFERSIDLLNRGDHKWWPRLILAPNGGASIDGQLPSFVNGVGRPAASTFQSDDDERHRQWLQEQHHRRLESIAKLNASTLGAAEIVRQLRLLVQRTTEFPVYQRDSKTHETAGYLVLRAFRIGALDGCPEAHADLIPCDADANFLAAWANTSVAVRKQRSMPSRSYLLTFTEDCGLIAGIIETGVQDTPPPSSILKTERLTPNETLAWNTMADKRLYARELGHLMNSGTQEAKECVMSIRAKLGKDTIKTCPGGGYIRPDRPPPPDHATTRKKRVSPTRTGN